jgi:hypothetical protein
VFCCDIYVLIQSSAQESVSGRLLALGGAEGEPVSRIMIICPESDMPFYTGLDMDHAAFESADLEDQSATCPHCGGVHAWRKEDAFLVGEE